METQVSLSDGVLASLLLELSEVFLKAEGYEDALAAAEWANSESDRLRGETVTYAERVLEQESEIERLQEQYAEASEEAFRRGQIIQDLTRVNDTRTEVIAALQKQLDTARRTFGDAFVYGAQPGAGPNRANRPKLTAAQVGGIRSMVGNGSTIRSVAKVYGVHPSTVSRIASGVYHKGEDQA